jgi:hypothetical protein
VIVAGYVEGVPVDEQCWHHGPEPIPAHYYILCVECGHCYVTAEDLEAAHREADARAMAAPWHESWVAAGLAYAGPWPELKASEIFACPLCAHDF